MSQFLVKTDFTQDLARGLVSADRFAVPWTFAGLSSAAGQTVSLRPLTTYYGAVRACYPDPAGCFDPVLADGITLDSVAPVAGSLGASYHDTGAGLVVMAWWQHFQEVTAPPSRNPDRDRCW